MMRWILYCVVTAACASVSIAQTQLARTVVANGGTLALASVDGSMFLSSTIGQAVIFSQARLDNSAVHQGFWVPLDYGLVSVDDGTDDATAGDVVNYPNPVTTSTTIRFSVPMDGRVTVRLFNLIGVMVRSLDVDMSVAGSQEILLTATDEYGSPLSSGTYMYEVVGTTASGSPLRRMQRLNILR